MSKNMGDVKIFPIFSKPFMEQNSTTQKNFEQSLKRSFGSKLNRSDLLLNHIPFSFKYKSLTTKANFYFSRKIKTYKHFFLLKANVALFLLLLTIISKTHFKFLSEVCLVAAFLIAVITDKYIQIKTEESSPTIYIKYDFSIYPSCAFIIHQQVKHLFIFYLKKKLISLKESSNKQFKD